MKRIIQGLVLATLVSTAQASPLPADGEGVLGIPVEWTYADKHAGEPNRFVGSTIPVGSEWFAFPAQSTYADKHAGEPNRLVGSAIPEDGEAFRLQARSTYVDRFAVKPAQRAGGASERAPALGE